MVTEVLLNWDGMAKDNERLSLSPKRLAYGSFVRERGSIASFLHIGTHHDTPSPWVR